MASNAENVSIWWRHHFVGNSIRYIHIFYLFLTLHDDVIKWKNFRRYWSFVRGIYHTKSNDTELWCFLWSPPEQTVENKQSRRRWFETPWRSLWRHWHEVIQIFPHGGQGDVNPVKPREWLLMAWRRRGAGHQQLWYGPHLHTRVLARKELRKSLIRVSARKVLIKRYIFVFIHV